MAKKGLGMASTASVERSGTELFLLVDGRRVARRGRPGTAEARTWVSLEPGWEVVELPGGYIELRMSRVH
jgi:hypothetical protein